MAKSTIEAKKAYHHGDLRAQLLEAVRHLVERKGPDGFSISECCRLAGVSTAAPYRHFRDRGDIMSAAVLQAMGRLEAHLSAGFRHPAGSLDRVVAIGQGYVDFARSEPGMFRMVFGVDKTEDPEAKAAGSRCFAILLQAVSEYLDHPVDSGEVAQASYLLWSLVHGHAFLVVDKHIAQDEMGGTEREILVAAGRGILGPPRAQTGDAAPRDRTEGD